MSRDALNVCAITIVGTVLKMIKSLCGVNVGGPKALLFKSKLPSSIETHIAETQAQKRYPLVPFSQDSVWLHFNLRRMS